MVCERNPMSKSSSTTSPHSTPRVWVLWWVYTGGVYLCFSSLTDQICFHFKQSSCIPWPCNGMRFTCTICVCKRLKLTWCFKPISFSFLCYSCNFQWLCAGLLTLPKRGWSTFNTVPERILRRHRWNAEAAAFPTCSFRYAGCVQ